MKQNITMDQVSELSAEGGEFLRSWSLSNNYQVVKNECVLFNIGQLFHFLRDMDRGYLVSFPKNAIGLPGIGIKIVGNPEKNDQELIDAMWSICKKVIERAVIEMKAKK